MEREEVELLPSGLITCLLNSKEVRIMKISPERLTIRLAQEVKEINELKVIFYVFDENIDVDKIYETIGYKWQSIVSKDKYSELQIVFMNDDKVRESMSFM